jgi:hypothetical protein
VKIATPTLHSVTQHLTDEHRTWKHEASFRFFAQWRGDPVQVDIAADRYKFSDGTISDWRFHVADARKREDGKVWGEQLSPTAHSRLRDACEAQVWAYLREDNPEYVEGEQRAVFRCILHVMQELGTYGSETQRARQLVDKYLTKLTGDQRETLLHVIGAAEAFQHAYEKAAS